MMVIFEQVIELVEDLQGAKGMIAPPPDGAGQTNRILSTQTAQKGADLPHPLNFSVIKALQKPPDQGLCP